MSISLKKVNNEKVEVVKLKDEIPLERIRGNAIIPYLYPNCFICAPTGSGKSTVLNTIIQKCMDKFTKIYIFNTQHDIDPMYVKVIKPWMDKHKINYECFDDLSTLPALVEEIHSAFKGAEKEEPETQEEQYLAFMMKCKKKRQERRDKLISPDFCFIFDDISENIAKNTFLSSLMKKNRKYHTAIYILSQYVYDIPKDSRNQIRMWVLLNGVGENALESIWNDACIRIPKKSFIELYKEITKEPYAFLMYDTGRKMFRKNFDYEIDI